MSFNYPNSDTIYLTVQANNNSQTNGNDLLCNIYQQTNFIVKDLSKYDLFLLGFSCTTDQLPYCNFKRNIQWNINNFTTNKTNLIISFMSSDPADRPFDLTGNTNTLLFGIGNSTGDTYQGCGCYLQYVSENSTLTNPNNEGTGANSKTYPIEYFDLHSISQFVSFINTAINSIYGTSQLQDKPYFYYNVDSQLYYFNCTDAYLSSSLDMYVNTFLERRLDGFRWITNSNINDLTLPNYTGQNFKLSKSYTPNLLNNNVWNIPSEYSTLANLVDVHSILITSNTGQLQSAARQEVVPYEIADNMNSQLDLPSLPVLKNLQIELGSLSLSSINNTIIQYSSEGMWIPINMLQQTPLNLISLSVFFQDIDNIIRPLYINSGGGYCNIKLALKSKN
jgi:hypothetical protein